jgi:hypothetical protein
MTRRIEMEKKSGWLGRSLDRARTNIEARPEHLKPERYRDKKVAPVGPSNKPADRQRAA